MKLEKIKRFLLLFFLLAALLPAQTALADTGPKPTMDFNFKGLDDGELQIISGTLFECDQADCSDAEPLMEAGPQRLRCSTTECSALAYGFAPYHILEVEFSDEVTRRSNVFETAGFNSVYNVTVQPNDLVVESQFSLGVLHPYLTMIILGCLCCLVVIALIVGVVIFFRKLSKRQ
jgi:hypothetical protein